MSDPVELTAEERQSLLAAPASRPPQGIDLAGRQLGQLALQDLQTEGRTWKELDLTATSLTGCAFRSGTLAAVNARNVAFARTSFHQVRFSGCNFEDCLFREALFVECEFANCRFLGSQFRLANFERCTFVDGRLEGCDLHGTRLYDTRFSKVAWLSSQHSESAFHGMELEACELTSLLFSQCESESLRLEGSRAQDVGFFQGRYGRIALHTSSVETLWLRDLHCTTLTLEAAPSIQDLRLITSTLGEVAVTGCPRVLGLSGFEAHVERLKLAESSFAATLLDGCQIGPESRFEGALFQGLSLTKTGANELTLSDVRVGKYLLLKGARFQGLRIENLRYEDDCQLDLSDVRYENSDRFPERD
jgi:uncharacterized protein YjbI with pentapeptide repeats